MRATITDRVRDNEVYIPLLSTKDEEAVNLLTSSDHDTYTYTYTPAYKEMRVKLEVLEFTGKSPIVKGNFRLGNPNPQPGVNVEKKWARGDYHPLLEL